MSDLPFEDEVFDKPLSVTAIEFISDARGAIKELFRVTRPGGAVVVATLNSLSPWSFRRKKEAATGRNPLFEKVVFRSPDEIRALVPPEFTTAHKIDCRIQTAIHFPKNEDPLRAVETEKRGQSQGLNTGAFVIARWEKRYGKAKDNTKDNK